MNGQEPTKAELRQQMRARLGALQPDDRAAAGRAAAQRLAQTPCYVGSRTLMVFLSLSDEIDTGPLIELARADGKRVVVPRVSGQDLELVGLDDPAASMDRDAMGVQTPVGGVVVHPQQVQLALVPGLAFDRTGRRLGRGGGFYDRFLAQPAWVGVACGFALDFQVVGGVPAAAHDEPVDQIVTEARFLEPVTDRG